MEKEQEAARILKAYFLQKRKADLEQTLVAWIPFAACQLGTCGEDLDEEETQKRRTDYNQSLQVAEHDTIVIYKLQQIIEGKI